MISILFTPFYISNTDYSQLSKTASKSSKGCFGFTLPLEKVQRDWRSRSKKTLFGSTFSKGGKGGK